MARKVDTLTHSEYRDTSSGLSHRQLISIPNLFLALDKRSNNAGDFIKHGEEKAELEIELFNDQGENYIIQSEISHTGR